MWIWLPENVLQMTNVTKIVKDQSKELACEEAIMNEKERFGRVRTSFMKEIREEYGEEMANRILSRINKRTRIQINNQLLFD